jgi:hypothetical protein
MRQVIASIDQLVCWSEWSMRDGSERRRARAFTITRLDMSRLACDTSSSVIRLTATARALFPDMPIIHACQPRSLRSRLLPETVSIAQHECIKVTHFFSFQRARRPTPETLTTLNRTPGISPFAFPRRPKPEIRTSSFSSVYY